MFDCGFTDCIRPLVTGLVVGVVVGAVGYVVIDRRRGLPSASRYERNLPPARDLPMLPPARTSRKRAAASA
jgi:hypothetical protein